MLERLLTNMWFINPFLVLTRGGICGLIVALHTFSSRRTLSSPAPPPTSTNTITSRTRRPLRLLLLEGQPGKENSSHGTQKGQNKVIKGKRWKRRNEGGTRYMFKVCMWGRGLQTAEIVIANSSYSPDTWKKSIISLIQFSRFTATREKHKFFLSFDINREALFCDSTSCIYFKPHVQFPQNKKGFLGFSK